MTIENLLELGAKTYDFSHIYCERCNFNRAGDLSYANFFHSYLSGADFSNMKLQHVHIWDSVLDGTSFFGADLHGFSFFMDQSSSTDVGHYNFPLFECADLTGSDIHGFPLLSVHKIYNWDGKRHRIISAPRLDHVRTDEKTKIEGFMVSVTNSVSDDYLKDSKSEDVSALFNDYRRHNGDRWFGDNGFRL